MWRRYAAACAFAGVVVMLSAGSAFGQIAGTWSGGQAGGVLGYEPHVEGTNVTGTWSGNVQLGFPCSYSNGSATVPISGTVQVQLTLSDSNDVVIGAMEIDGIPNTDNSCNVSGGIGTVIGALSGNVSGSTLSATFTGGDKGNSFTFSGTISGTSMSVTLQNGGTVGVTTFSGTLTQTSSQAPDMTLTGLYSGTVTIVFIPCGVLAPVTTSGTLTGSLVQIGTTLLGTITLTGGKKDNLDSAGNCTVVDAAPGTVSLSAQINGNTLTGTTIELGHDGKEKPFTATITGNTITGTMSGNYPGESSTFTLTKTSTSASTPAVLSFSANPSTITPGQSATLSWTTFNASSVSIDNGVGAQPASGNATVSPGATTTFTLTAQGAAGSATAAITVTVSTSPQVVVSALPRGMLATPGATATDQFSVTNTGGGDGQVNVSINGSAFTVSPSSFTVPAGDSQLVVVHAIAQAVGTYTGSVTVATAGTSQQSSFSLTLLVATPPTGTVSPQPATTRVDVNASAGQNPTGSVQFTNSGSATLQGIAVADVPWILPQAGTITIAPGATQTITFTIDRSKRPDNGTLGGLSGHIALLYLGSASGKGAILGTTPTSSISVTVVDVVNPGAAPGTPPPLQPGELALFMTGLTSDTARNRGDLLFSSRSPASSINDLRVYFTPATSPAQVSSIPQFPTNTGVAFPAIIHNVFGASSSAPLVLRSSNTANLSVAGIRLVTVANNTQLMGTALPVLRSDRGIEQGEKLLLSGIDRIDSGQDPITTSVYIQDVTGTGGSASLDYRDAAGNPVGTGSGTVNPFSAVVNGPPAGAKSVVVTNTSTSPSRLSAYGFVMDANTGDGWVVTDPSRASGVTGDTLIVPLVMAPNAAGQTQDLFVTNSSQASVNVGIEIRTANGRRRTAKASSVHAPDSYAANTSAVAPLATSRTSMPAVTGYARITGQAGAISAAGRVTLSGFTGLFGSALPVMPAAAGLANGQSQRFTGVDDASATSIASSTPGTYRSSLILIESAGQTATVTVSLQYSFGAGALVTAQAASSRTFVLLANQMTDVSDLARSVIGAQRDAFGDLRNMQVDVSVVGGSGKVLAFIESIDNGSGDLIVRSE